MSMATELFIAHPVLMFDRLPSTASGLDQPQRFPTDEDLCIVSFTPRERRHVAVLADRTSAMPLFETGTGWAPRREAHPVRVSREKS